MTTTVDTREQAIEPEVYSWLEARRGHIGASESPAILGCGYKSQSAYGVWARKTGLEVDTGDDDEDESLEIGRAIQPFVIGMFEKRSGFTVYDLGEFTIQRHPDISWLGCTLDGFIPETDEGPAVVEAKNVSVFAGSEWKGDEPPLRVNVQVQHQMTVPVLFDGKLLVPQVAYVVGLIGGNRLIYKKVYRSQKFIDAMLPHLAAFWRLVETRTPPPIDHTQATADALRRMFPHERGGKVALGPEFDRHYTELSAIKAAQKLLKARATHLGNLFKAAIGDASEAVLPSGNTVSWREQHRDGYYVEPTDYRVLRQHQGKLPAVVEARNTCERVALATAELMNMGAELRHASVSGGSWYFVLAGGLQVRLSDHEPNEKTEQWIERRNVAEIRVDQDTWRDQLAAIVGNEQSEDDDE